MANRRMIHSKIWSSEQFGFLSIKARLLFIGTITIADDEGKLKGNPAFLRSQIFPYDDKITSDEVKQLLQELTNKKLIINYEVEGCQYLYHPNWSKYQTLRSDRIKDSFIPSPTDCQPNVNQLGADCQPNDRLSKDKLSKDKLSKRDYVSAVLDYWNDKKIVTHRTIAKDAKKEINKLVDESYLLEDLKKAIDLYSTILNGKEYFWSYKWNLYEFLKRGLKKFEGKTPQDYLKSETNFARQGQVNKY